ncbi:hypothetical protein SGPA1_10504 [Streptomyces misionensis JCM 4497]
MAAPRHESAATPRPGARPTSRDRTATSAHPCSMGTERPRSRESLARTGPRLGLPSRKGVNVATPHAVGITLCRKPGPALEAVIDDALLGRGCCGQGGAV